MDIDRIKATFRTPDLGNYPELQGISREEVYAGKMGPGGLFLAAQMGRRMGLSPGMRVLDLGCGRGTTSIFLARRYGVQVVAVDLWIKATAMFENFQRHGLDDRIFPLNLDITEKLPFAEGCFDAIFCMDSVHYYGGEPGFWGHLLPHLKPGGVLSLGSPCFNEEFTPEALGALPPEYDDGTDLWPVEFSRYHSPRWWEALLEGTGLVEVQESVALDDGVVFWEDDVLDNLARGGDEATAAQDAAQIRFRREGLPWLTHFVLTARKHTDAAP